MRLTHSGPRPLPIQLVVVALAGGATSLAFPPAGMWPVAFVALAPLYRLVRGARPARGALLGFIYGAVFYGVTLSWIYRFGLGAWVALTILCALSTAVVGLLAPVFCGRGGPVRGALGFAALWTVVDLARGSWPLGGFTWGALGISQADNRVTVRLASVTGVWGVTFVVVLANALLVAALLEEGVLLRRAGRAALGLAVVLAPFCIAFPRATGPGVDIAAIQLDVRTATGPGDIASKDAALQRTLRKRPPDLVVWGEGAVDPVALADPRVVNNIRSAIASVGAPTVIGAVVDDPDGSEHTSALAFDGSGALVDRYDKVHLVPYGEYVPLRSELSWVRALRQVPIDRAAGERIRPLSIPGVASFGTPICFENSFPAIAREMVRAGAQFLIVPVNNASYGFSAAGAQHLEMSRLRAIEDGRWVVDAAVSGPSAFIDPSGRVTAQAGLFDEAILRATIRSSSERTWYVRLGDWFPWLAAVFLGALLLRAPKRGDRRVPLGPLPASPRTLVILPTFQEAETIAMIVTRLRTLRPAPDLVVVDDSSPDGTAEIVRGLAAEDAGVQILVRPSKSGLASAYLEGFQVALTGGYDLIVEMDADVSHDPDELLGLLEGGARHHLTIGSRYVPGGSVTNWSRARVALSRGGNRYARWLLGLPFKDATSGFRVYRRELLERLVQEPFASDGYGFQIELATRAWRMGYDVGEAPITFSERVYGESKISRRIVLEALLLITRWGVAARLGGKLPGDDSP